MTFDEIVDEIKGRLNLTSDEATTRIGELVNRRYRKVTTSIGLQTSRRVVIELTVDPTDPGSILPDLEIEGIEKVLAIRIVSDSGGIRVLRHLTYDEIKAIPTRTSPFAFAVKLMEAGQVTITLDGYNTANEFELMVEGYISASTLSGTSVPNFPEDFHDVLVEGVMSDELRKMEKPQLAAMAEVNYREILSDLRMFIAKSAYMDMYQGKSEGMMRYPNWVGRTYNDE